MKNIIIKSIVALALIISVNAASAKGNGLNYSRSLNPLIGISAGNNAAVGGTFKVLDGNGRVVLQGRIKSTDTFYLPTNKLMNGTYLFTVDGYSLQQFSVNN